LALLPALVCARAQSRAFLAASSRNAARRDASASPSDVPAGYRFRKAAALAPKRRPTSSVSSRAGRAACRLESGRLAPHAALPRKRRRFLRPRRARPSPPRHASTSARCAPERAVRWRGGTGPWSATRQRRRGSAARRPIAPSASHDSGRRQMRNDDHALSGQRVAVASRSAADGERAAMRPDDHRPSFRRRGSGSPDVEIQAVFAW
jgi:hypothetical protein